MNDAFVVLIRQVALVYGTYLVTSGKLDPELLQPWIGAVLAFSSVGWMVWDRFLYPKIQLWIVTKDHNDDTVVIKTDTQTTSVSSAVQLVNNNAVTKVIVTPTTPSIPSA